MSNTITLNNAVVAGVTVAATPTTTLVSLTDVQIAALADSERLVYDASAGKWRNRESIDGGSY